MNNAFIYLRGLKSVDHTVFAVEEGQKRYWDPQFQREVAFASGQQIKRSIVEDVLTNLNLQPAPITFYFEGDKLKEKEVTSPANPLYIDQLLTGWMIAKSGEAGKAKKVKTADTEKSEDVRTIKRRSPLSISALHPLHPLLGTISSENISFDRSDKPGIHKVVVKDTNGKVLNEEEIKALLEGTNRSLLRKWIPENKRTSGLFIYDIAIDLRTLFSVSTNLLEPELDTKTIDELKNKGWTESKNVFGDCLVAPKETREKVITALAHSLLNWRITTNQSRTFSPMATLAVAVSDNAQKIAEAIRAALDSESEKPKALPVIDDTVDAHLFVTPICAAYIPGVVATAKALKEAEEKLIHLMSEYNYTSQM